MKLLAASAVLCCLTVVPTFAYQEQQQDEKAKPQQQGENQKSGQEPKTEGRQDKQQQEGGKQQEKTAKQEEKQQKQADKQQQEGGKQQEKQQKEMEKQERAREKPPGQQEQGNRVAQQPAAAPAHGGRRIPDDRFRAEFGRKHHFHIPIHRGDRSFAYGGYSFQFVDAWPAGWAYTDEFYIDLVGQDYYLCDVAHPGVQLGVVIAA
jgi:hypothetical protein